jgi:cyclopropane-fatty-acyl-phospholipid synthase
MLTTIANDSPSQLQAGDVRRTDNPRLVVGNGNGSWLEGRIAAAVQKMLSSITGGQIEFHNGLQLQSFGSCATDSLRSDWNIDDSRFYRQLLSGGSLGLAESYMSGFWSSSDLTALLRILYRNTERFDSIDQGFSRLASAIARFAHRLASNTVAGSRRNIAAHYDLSDDFFELFLDRSMMYSSAYYQDESMSLEQASTAKLEQLCRKLDLKGGDHVMEIGTGWGGFAVHAANNYGSQVTTTTISNNQYESAKRKIRLSGVADRVELLKKDYRDLTGRYDKLVSIEMVEAVGEQFLDSYFRKCGQLLKPGGRFVLQGIVMPEQRYASYRNSVDFIQKHIFPGGFLPSIAAICESVGRTSQLSLQNVEDLSPHYARTLFHWRGRFVSRLADVRALGFDERFIRMWKYYLCYCEAAFSEQAVKVVQIVWDKPTQ